MTAQKADLYQIVTNKIVAQLEAGANPFKQPWVARNGGSFVPTNYTTGKSYTGINVILCWLAGFQDQRYLTYKQAQAIGAQVRGGSQGTTLYYADNFVPKKDRLAAAPGEKVRPVFFLKAFTVFNVSQIDGLPAEIAPVAAPVVTPDEAASAVIEASQKIVNDFGIEIRHGGDSAYYAPSLDIIALPALDAFDTALDYYRTAFHELAHATGHKSRLDRNLTGSTSKESFAREELVAEVAASFVSASVGIEHCPRHADYLASWIKVLKEDKHAIFRAASAATKAADWVLGRKRSTAAQEGQDEPQEVAQAA